MRILGVCKLLLVLSAITCLVIGVFLAFFTITFVFSSTKCHGVVIDVISERSKESGRSLYRPKIEYVLPSGEKRVFVSSVASSPQRYFVGDKVAVLYCENHILGEAKIGRFFEIWTGAIIFLASGITCVFFIWILRCLCPPAVRDAEKGELHAETGAKIEGNYDEESSENGVNR